MSTYVSREKSLTHANFLPRAALKRRLRTRCDCYRYNITFWRFLEAERSR